MPSFRKEGCVSSLLLGFSHCNVHMSPRSCSSTDSDPVGSELSLRFCLFSKLPGDVPAAGPLVCSPHFDLDPKPVDATEGTRPRRWCENSSNHGWFPWQQFFHGTPSAQPPLTRSRLSQPHHPPTLAPVKTYWKLALKRRKPAVRHLVSPTAVHSRGSTLVSTLF